MNILHKIAKWLTVSLLGILSLFLIAATSKPTIGPTTATTDNAIVRWNGTDSFKLQNSSGIIDDSGNLSGINNLSLNGRIKAPSSGISYEPSKTYLLFEGDSLTAGWASSWPSYFTNLVPWQGFAYVQNTAVSGETPTQIDTQYATQIYPYRPGAGTNALLFIWMGANQILAHTPAENISILSNYWVRAQGDGFTVVAATIMGRYDSWGMGVGWETNRFQVNDWIRKSRIPDYLIDADTLFSDPTDTRYFTDTIHLTTTGYQLFANIVDYTIRSSFRGVGNLADVGQLRKWGTNWYVRDINGVARLTLDGLGVVTANRFDGNVSTGVTNQWKSDATNAANAIASTAASTATTKAAFTTNYTTVAGDQLLFCTGTNQVVTLLSAATAGAGKWYLVNVASTTGSVVLTNAAGTTQTVKSSTTGIVVNGTNMVSVVSDGTNWW